MSPQREPIRSSPGREAKVILTFIGSVDRQCVYTTVGDVMALYNVYKTISPRIDDVRIAWSHDLFDLSDRCRRLNDYDAGSFSTMVFVCGPIHEPLRRLFRRFRHAKRIAVGVSVPRGVNPTSFVSACHIRDSDESVSFDLALADISYPHHRLAGDERQEGAAICLVGPQPEYGEDNGSDRAERIIRDATANIPTREVSTLLDLKRRSPTSVEEDLQSSKVLLAHSGASGQSIQQHPVSHSGVSGHCEVTLLSAVC